MCSNDDIDWPVHSLMLSFYALRGLPLRRLPSTIPCNMIFRSPGWLLSVHVQNLTTYSVCPTQTFCNWPIITFSLAVMDFPTLGHPIQLKMSYFCTTISRSPLSLYSGLRRQKTVPAVLSSVVSGNKIQTAEGVTITLIKGSLVDQRVSWLSTDTLTYWKWKTSHSL